MLIVGRRAGGLGLAGWGWGTARARSGRGVRWPGRVLSETVPEGHQPVCSLSNSMTWQAVALDSVGPKPDNLICYSAIGGREESEGWKTNGIVLKCERSEISCLSRFTMGIVNLMEALG